MKTEQIHISKLETGMTVFVKGETKTVDRNKHVKKGFTGWCFDGDPFYETKGYITRVLVPRWYKGEIIYYV